VGWAGLCLVCSHNWPLRVLLRESVPDVKRSALPPRDADRSAMMSEKQMVSLWVSVRVFTLQCDSPAALEALESLGRRSANCTVGSSGASLLQQESRLWVVASAQQMLPALCWLPAGQMRLSLLIHLS
jgi:hypothetical protein